MNKQEQQYTIDQAIEASFDFSASTEEEKLKMISETSSMIMEAAILRSLADAGKETQDSFKKMIEGEPSEELMSAFIAEHFPEFQKVVISELDMFLNSEDTEVLSPSKAE